MLAHPQISHRESGYGLGEPMHTFLLVAGVIALAVIDMFVDRNVIVGGTWTEPKQWAFCRRCELPIRHCEHHGGSHGTWEHVHDGSHWCGGMEITHH